MSLWTFLGLVAFAGSLAASIHLLLHYRRPTAAVAWFFGLWVVPILGALVYLMFAVYEGPRKIRRRRRLSRQLRAAEDRELAKGVERSSAVHSLLGRIAEGTRALPMTHGNDVHLHGDPEEARSEYLRCLRSARSEILLESYIWTADELTEEISEILLERVAAGVDVRVLVDDIGARLTAGGLLPKLAAGGVATARFLPPNPLRGRFQINFRNHRKLLVVDGEVAVTGGRNCDVRYFHEGDDGRRDISIALRGPAVSVLRSVFAEDWCVATDSTATDLEDRPIPAACGSSDLRVIPHGCDEPTDAFVPIVSSAIRSAREHVLIVTPYFVPGPEMLHDLRLCALSGTRVQLLIPERSPERGPELAARRYFESLFDCGVEIHVRPDPFLHAKAIVVDREWVVLGSANFDQRSFHLNYELSCEIPDEDLAREVLAYFEPDLRLARRLEPERFRERPWSERLKENAAALFSPIL